MIYRIRRGIMEAAQLVASRYGSAGIDVFADIKSRKAAFDPKTVVDVGANSGSVSIMLTRMFPKAQIIALEPSKKNAEELRRNASQYRNISVHQVAISSESGVIGFIDDPENHTMSRVGDGGYEVKMSTLDEFCAEIKVARIDYLKIDTEGHDLAVISGAKKMLERKEIAYIEVECGMNPDNQYHVPFEKIKSVLEGFDYRLFGIYEQTKEWIKDLPNLRRVNSVFMPRPE